MKAALVQSGLCGERNARRTEYQQTNRASRARGKKDYSNSRYYSGIGTLGVDSGGRAGGRAVAVLPVPATFFGAGWPLPWPAGCLAPLLTALRKQSTIHLNLPATRNPPKTLAAIASIASHPDTNSSNAVRLPSKHPAT
jgi:hypothetical protein